MLHGQQVNNPEMAIGSFLRAGSDHIRNATGRDQTEPDPTQSVTLFAAIYFLIGE